MKQLTPGTGQRVMRSFRVRPPSGLSRSNRRMIMSDRKTDLSAGVIVKRFPVVCGNLSVGKSEYVTYYGTAYKITRVDNSDYGFIAELEG